MDFDHKKQGSDNEMKPYSQIPAAAYVILLSLQVPLNISFLLIAANGLASGKLPISGEGLFFVYIGAAVFYFLVLGILGITNIVRSFLAYGRGDEEHCLRGMLILKYGMVPFFIINFCSILLLSLAALVGSRGTLLFAFPVTVPLLFLAFFCTWLAMVPGSFYSIQVIRLTRKKGKTNLLWAVWHGLLQFCFLTDVLDTMYLAVRKWNRGKLGAALIGLLYIGAAGWIILTVFAS